MSGYTGSYTAATENWDGSSWTEVADVATGRNEAAGVGTNTLGLLAGGYQGTAYQALTEEWSFAATVETVAFD